ncbi:hypothetical protein [Natrinema versiforme]|uniref:Uncharacterized protein n=1 Tax=Natrinema versiforme TaxID=88724 RepID=A0A4P8WJD7_9EURY|nr:hypothetical protein [Natrinema versiforme]QCS43394.1 hypothetical protein FEJ81_13920 [Natrinema versiforme]
MGRQHVKRVIRFLKGSKDCSEEMIAIAYRFLRNGIGPAHEGIKSSDTETELNLSLTYDPKTSLDHLQEIGLVESDPEVADDLRTFVIAEWLGTDGEIINGEVEDTAEDALEALIDHMHATDTGDSAAVADGGVTHRSVLKDEFGINPARIENRLRTGDPVKTLRTAVPAIQDHPGLSTRGDYGMITFRYEAYRYTLTSEAVNLYRL